MKIEYRKTRELTPYKNNPRKNDQAAERVAESIRAFGFKVPIIVDTSGVIVAGHTRLKAAEILGLTEVPVIVASDLSEEQARAFRLADNKVGELATWDSELLSIELDQILDFEMADFGFSSSDSLHFWGDEEGESTEEYEAFVDKFAPKLTTDDCYTPPEVYEAIKGWAVREYGLGSRPIVRPFYPGGNYREEDYPDGCVVIDNPPFSIETEIVRFYVERGIDFFLFAPALTAFAGGDAAVNYICANAEITYENGAEVNTSFITTLGDWKLDTAPELRDLVEESQAKETVSLPRYEYPDCVLTSAATGRLSKYGQRLRIKDRDIRFIRKLDAQTELGKAIYGGGLLLSKKAAAERAAAERAAADKAARDARDRQVWELSEREEQIVESLGKE